MNSMVDLRHHVNWAMREEENKFALFLKELNSIFTKLNNAEHGPIANLSNF